METDRRMLLENLLGADKVFSSWTKLSEQQHFTFAASGSIGSFASLLVEELASRTGKSFIAVASSDTGANSLYEDLESLDINDLYFFPRKDFITGEVFSRSKEAEWQRVKVLNKQKTKINIVTSIDALIHGLMPVDKMANAAITLALGESASFDMLIRRLLDFGYERTQIIDSRGQMSVRGNILDVYDPEYENPIRMEFFGDEIDSIRFFDIETQKSIDKLEYINILPCQELVYEEGTVEKLAKLGLDESTISERPEGLAAYVYNKIDHLLDYFPEHVVIFMDLFKINERYRHIKEEALLRFESDIEMMRILPRQVEILIDFESMTRKMKNSVIDFSLVHQDVENLSMEEVINFHMAPVDQFHSNLDNLIESCLQNSHRGYKTILCVQSGEKASMIAKAFSRVGRVLVDLEKEEMIFTGQIGIMTANLSEGFYMPSSKVYLIADSDIFGTRKKKKISSRFSENTRVIKSFRELEIGDYVVHETHGIAKYIGVEKVNTDNVIKDYMKLSYQNEEFLYIPIDQMNVIQKYIGADAKTVKLSRLGSSEWKKATSRARKAIEDMTDQLLELYSKRASQKGHQFSEDDEWQREFEALFPYVETQDQLKCIEEIKQDMQKTMPMDRLLCGDVGFGKTEVALRAVFKAVNDGKQVALLVPTTILAQQHFQNIKERFSSYPIRIEMMSRFRTIKQNNDTARDIGRGLVDVVIGTHRVLSEDVKFKDLGLLVVDEEQRFGVKHKEKLKQMKTSVDVLSMSATPIPRTLNMSLVGIRDISVINDPPEDRYPIQTYITEMKENVIREAVLREYDRNGQVYIVYNRVEDIDLFTDKLRRLIPEVKMEFAHGQMSERLLEKIMVGFLSHEFDVLVSTTIIETGLDISNTNTIIITDADRMGLSQLYQLRGRVGRSNRVAYAYLMFRKDKLISEIAQKRLVAIKEFTQLGSGFKIAMRDLEIRGSGNLLGSSQSGHMEAIGYEMYTKLLEEKMRQIKGEVVIEEVNAQIDIKVDSYIPEYFISDVHQKIEMYKKIAAIESVQDKYEVEEELEDRFGNIPESVYNLMSISYIRALASRIPISMITHSDRGFRFIFDEKRPPKAQYMEKIFSAPQSSYKLITGKHQGIELYFRPGLDTMKKKVSFLEKYLEKIVS